MGFASWARGRGRQGHPSLGRSQDAARRLWKLKGGGSQAQAGGTVPGSGCRTWGAGHRNPAGYRDPLAFGLAPSSLVAGPPRTLSEVRGSDLGVSRLSHGPGVQLVWAHPERGEGCSVGGCWGSVAMAAPLKLALKVSEGRAARPLTRRGQKTSPCPAHSLVSPRDDPVLAESACRLGP